MTFVIHTRRMLFVALIEKERGRERERERERVSDETAENRAVWRNASDSPIDFP